MKLVKSELILKDFYILNCTYSFTDNPHDELQTETFTDDYELDIDFIVKQNNNSKKEEYFIMLKIGINNIEDNLPGYSLFTEGIAFFSFSEQSKLTDNQKSDFLWHSGVSIAINNMRSYIANITSYYPLGKYTLPSVDLTNILNSKREQLENALQKRKGKND